MRAKDLYNNSKMKKFKCSICEQDVHEWGNNPQPIKLQSGKLCCDACNSKYVYPARMFMRELLNNKQ